MQLFNQIFNVSDNYPNISVALGTFDGVHIGHQKIIGEAVRLAKEMQGTSVVFTFSNHPLSVIDSARCPLQIITNEQKALLMSNLGVDILLNVPFTTELLKLSPNEFIQLLRHNLQPKQIVVGPNYSFGYKSKGTPELLCEFEKQFGFKVDIHPAVYLDGNMVSSTLIRQLISEGNVKECQRFLGRLYSLSGTVINGDKRGRTLGYPTANLAIPAYLAVPANGVYAVRVLIDDAVTYNGVANIGTNPTFEGISRHIEVHILNFNDNLYNKTITIEFLDRIRHEKRFNSINELKKQIYTDIQIANKVF